MCGKGDFAPFLSSCYYRVKKYLDSVEKWGLEYIRRMKRAEDKQGGKFDEGRGIIRIKMWIGNCIY